MGYTHYIDQKRSFTQAEWAEIARGSRAVFTLARKRKIALADWTGDKGTPEATDEGISFNGLGDLGHESFSITRIKDEWSFCKTAQKPYDAAVTAILIYLDAIHPDAIEIKSDGGPEDWGKSDGISLAKQAWPEVAGRLDLPEKGPVRKLKGPKGIPNLEKLHHPGFTPSRRDQELT